MFDEQIVEKLKAPFHPRDVKSRKGYGAGKSKLLHYIDARNVMDRLDEAVGVGNWSNSFYFDGARTICKLTVFDVTKEDGAGDTNIEGEKGGLSDSLKRSAVMFGIGRYLYEGKDPKIVYEEYTGKKVNIKPKGGSQNFSAKELLDTLGKCKNKEDLNSFRLKHKDDILSLGKEDKEKVMDKFKDLKIEVNKETA